MAMCPCGFLFKPVTIHYSIQEQQVNGKNINDH
jgi:hypothetical protein